MTHIASGTTITYNRESKTTSRTRTWRSLPPQKVSKAIKESQEWQESNLDAIIGMSQARGDNGRSPRYNKQENYDLINGKYKASNFQSVLNEYNYTSTQYIKPETAITNYNIIRQKLETLKGEEMKMGLNFRAVAVNGSVVVQKNLERQQAILEAVKARSMAIATGDLDENGEPNAPDPAIVAASFNTEYSHPTEIATNQILNFLIKHDMLQSKFSRGWEHALISAEEIYYIGVVDGHPTVRSCNPLNVSFDREVENPLVHKADWAMEERWMPAGSVIDIYGDYLSDDLIERMDNGELGGTSVMSNGMSRDFAYTFDGAMRLNTGIIQNTSHVYVAHCTWRSYKKWGKLSYLDPITNKMESMLVEDDFKLTPQMRKEGATISWFWKTEIWEGTRIGHKDYVNIRPLPNQTGNLPYVGYIYNNVNSIATSLVDMVKPHQYTYIIVWHRLEEELKKAKGKKFLMDLAMIPKSQGWTTEQWMYYFDNMGVAWINSMEEGRKGDPNSTSKFNQFQAIDMSLSNIVGQYMQVLAKLEEQVDNISGVSKQREGAIGASETATGAQRAIIQSNNNTKPLFFYHDMVRQVVLQELLEKAKIAYADGVKLEYVVNPKTVETIRIDAGELNTSHFGVFMTDSFEESETMEKLERYLEVALQTDKANLSDIIAVISSKSPSEVKDVIVKGERDKIEREQQSAKVQQEHEAQMQQKLLEDQQYSRDFAKYEVDLKANTALEVATINAASKSTSTESNILEDTSIQDDIAKRKLELDEFKVKHTASLDIRKQNEVERNNKVKEVIAKKKKSAS